MSDYRLRLTKAIVECHYQGCPLRESCDLSLRQLFVLDIYHVVRGYNGADWTLRVTKSNCIDEKNHNG